MSTLKHLENRNQDAVNRLNALRELLAESSDAGERDQLRAEIKVAKNTAVATHAAVSDACDAFHAGCKAVLSAGGGEPHMVDRNLISVSFGPTVGGASRYVRPSDPEWLPMLRQIVARYRANGGKRESAPAYMLEAWE